MDGLERLGHRHLREQLAPVIRRLTRLKRTAAVTNRNKVEAFIVPAAIFEEWANAKADLGRLRQSMPLLMAAVSAGAAIPSETLDSLGIRFDFDWQKVNAFQAAFPISITHDEYGHPLPSMPDAAPMPSLEADDEIHWRGQSVK